MVRRIIERLRYGTAIGGLFATVLVAIGMLHRIAHGSDPLIARGQVINPWAAAGGYLLGAALGGAITGLLMPLTRRRTSAALVGALALAPVIGGMMIGVGESGWTRGHTIATVAVSVLLGGVIGATTLPLLHEK